MNKLWVIFITLFLSLPARAQELVTPDITVEKPVEEEKEEEVDTVLRYRRVKLNPDTLNSLRTDAKMSWRKDLDSLLKDLKDKELNKPPKKEEKKPPRKRSNWLADFFNSGFAKLLLITLGVLIVSFVVYNLVISDGAFRRRTKKMKQVTNEEAVEPELHTESDYDRQIRLAKETGNYRLAVRYLFLKTLYQLGEKKWVQLSSDKTNFDYLNELTGHPLRNEFATLALHYDYVWYGEFAVNEILYQKIETNFNQFNSRI